ncbi:MAG TPA: hypothetical protein VN875_09095 [Candidatus Binatus sp.]|nr:hypothetical protein [Candidatus Binatus sp.]
MTEENNLAKEVTEALSHGYGPRVARFALACLGAIPIAGGVFAGAGSAWSEADQAHYNKVFASWLRLQEDELREIGVTIAEILSRLDLNDVNVQRRIESPGYLSLIKKCFRDWSAAESEEKRILIRNLLTNAAVHRICSDDVLRIFIQWIEMFSEAHLAVIKYVYQNEGSTRSEIWSGVHGEKVREDSAEADLFKLLMHDLTTGYVIRQHREKDYYGNFVKSARRPRSPSQTMTSAFDDDKPYELTELGKQFVRYTMEGVMPRIAAPPDATPNAGGASEA